MTVDTSGLWIGDARLLLGGMRRLILGVAADSGRIPSFTSSLHIEVADLLADAAMGEGYPGDDIVGRRSMFQLIAHYWLKNAIRDGTFRCREIPDMNALRLFRPILPLHFFSCDREGTMEKTIICEFVPAEADTLLSDRRRAIDFEALNGWWAANEATDIPLVATPDSYLRTLYPDPRECLPLLWAMCVSTSHGRQADDVGSLRVLLERILQAGLCPGVADALWEEFRRQSGTPEIIRTERLARDRAATKPFQTMRALEARLFNAIADECEAEGGPPVIRTRILRMSLLESAGSLLETSLNRV